MLPFIGTCEVIEMRRKIDAGSSDLRKASMPTPSDRKPLPLRIKDLIERGLIPVPTRIFGFHAGKRIQARLGVERQHRRHSLRLRWARPYVRASQATARPAQIARPTSLESRKRAPARVSTLRAQ